MNDHDPLLQLQRHPPAPPATRSWPRSRILQLGVALAALAVGLLALHLAPSAQPAAGFQPTSPAGASHMPPAEIR